MLGPLSGKKRCKHQLLLMLYGKGVMLNRQLTTVDLKADGGF
jgi:hypothetical protein